MTRARDFAVNKAPIIKSVLRQASIHGFPDPAVTNLTTCFPLVGTPIRTSSPGKDCIMIKHGNSRNVLEFDYLQISRSTWWLRRLGFRVGSYFRSLSTFYLQSRADSWDTEAYNMNFILKLETCHNLTHHRQLLENMPLFSRVIQVQVSLTIWPESVIDDGIYRTHFFHHVDHT